MGHALKLKPLRIPVWMRREDIERISDEKYDAVMKQIQPKKPVASPVILGFDSEFSPRTSELISVQFAVVKNGELRSNLFYLDSLTAQDLLGYVLIFLGETGIAIRVEKPRIYLVSHFAQAEISKVRDYLKEFKIKVYNKAMSGEGEFVWTGEEEYENEVHVKSVKLGKYRIKILDLYGYFPRKLEDIADMIGLPKLEVDASRIDEIRRENPALFEAYAKRDAEICLKAFIELRDLFLKEYQVDILYYPTTASLAGTVFRQRFLKGPTAPMREEVKAFRKLTKKKGWVTTYRKTALFDGSRDVRHMSLLCYWGGRAEAYVRGLTKGDFEYRDVVSLYPSVALLQPLPTENTKWIQFSSLEEALPLEGFCQVTFQFPSDCRYPCFPVMVPGINKLLFPLKGESYCTVAEIKAALKMGVKIHTIRGWGFKPAKPEIEHNLAVFMKHFMQRKSSESKGTIRYEMWKLIMNSIVGKFNQKNPEIGLTEVQSFMLRKGLSLEEMSRWLSDYRLRGLIAKPRSVGACWAPEWASLITGRARALMAEFIAKGSLFCSTDSVLLPRGTDLECDALTQLRSVGSDLQKEFDVDTAFIARTRLYALMKDGKIVKNARHGTIASEEGFNEVVLKCLEAGRDLELPVQKIHLVGLKEVFKKGKRLGEEELLERKILWGWDDKRIPVNPDTNLFAEYSETIPHMDAMDLIRKATEEIQTIKQPKKELKAGRVGRPRKLGEDAAKEIVKLHRRGVPIRKLARKYRVSVGTIHKITILLHE